MHAFSIGPNTTWGGSLRIPLPGHPAAMVICIWEVLPSLGLKLAHQHISLRPATNFLLNHQRTLDVLVASAMKLRPFTLLKN